MIGVTVWGLYLVGIAMIALGLLLISQGTIEVIGPVYIVLGGAMVVLGSYWIVRVRGVARKLRAMEGRRAVKISSLAIFLILTAAMVAAVVAEAQTREDVQTCYTMYRRILFAQYFILGLLLVAGLIAFAPILLGRTTLGTVLQELSPLAGSMLVLLIFVLIALFPLDPMFNLQYDQGGNVVKCELDISKLEGEGPPLLRVLLKLLKPPAAPG